MRALVDALLDPQQLSELTGRDLVADRVRIKDGTSVVVGLRTPSGEPDGWARILWPGAQDKAHKVAERAGRRGHRLVTRMLPDGLLLQVGEVAADPVLAAPLRSAVADAVLALDDEVLRYNPLRRLVVRRGSTTVRVATHADPVALPLDWTLAEAGVPVPGRLDDGSRPQVAVQRFVGDTDLAATPDLAATRRAGAALARLHGVRLPEALREALVGREVDVAEQARAHEALLRPLDPALADRVAEVGGRVAAAWASVPDAAVLVHGDASPDQVLLDTATGQVWITDFERACLAHPAVDLGSYLANCSDDEGAALLEGYAAAGGEVPAESVLAAARERAVLLAVVDPLRRARPHWRAEIGRSLTAAPVVRRAWPDVDGRLTVELTDESGLRAGRIDLDGALRLTPPATDRKLPALTPDLPGRLVVHRLHKRAVVLTDDRAIKILRPGKAPRVARVTRAMGAACAAAGFGTAEVLSVGDDVVEFSLLPGRSLHDLGDDALPGWAALADGWPSFAGTVVDLPEHTADDEVAVLRTWLGHAQRFGSLGRLPELAAAVDDTCAALAEAPDPVVTLHRDLHDKQALWDGSRLHLLDLDTAARGEAALDLANLLVHVELRHAQGTLTRPDDVLAALAPAVEALRISPQRLDAYARASRLRLAFLYSFRPAAAPWLDAWTVQALTRK